VFWIGIFAIPLLAWFLPLSLIDRQNLLGILIAAIIFTGAFFRVLIPRLGARRWLTYLGVLGTISIITYLTFLLKPYQIHIEILYIAVIASAGVIAGKEVALVAVLFSLVGYTFVITLRGWPISAEDLTPLTIHVLVLSLTGYAISEITGALRKHMTTSERQNRYLYTLLQAGLVASRNEDLRETLSKIAEMICHGLPITVCRICLLAPENDQLETYGAYPLRKIPGWDHSDSACYPWEAFPELHNSLKTGEPLILKKAELDRIIEGKNDLASFYKGVQTVCILPLITKNNILGLIAIGEQRRWEREPCDPGKMGLLQTLAIQTSAAIHSARLHEAAQLQINRMAMLNEVAHAIGSTIELNGLLELIYEQLSKVLPSDTYFVCLYNEVDKSLDLRILIDNGERFPPQKIHSITGFSGWVLNNREPLLVRYLSEELDTLPAKPLQLGQDQMSESWLGVPMLAGEDLLGLLAIASYSPLAFDQDDVALLSSVAAQAALAIDNARHHAEVEEQASRDSLTNAYNHGSFLARLDEAIEQARVSSTQVALIMLDIDYFKDYNDTYGHQVGDEVLCRLVQTIQAHVKAHDTVGRWGGEEFGVILPTASNEQALQVAERIRITLAEAQLKVSEDMIDGSPIHIIGDAKGMATDCDLEGGSIPSPTVSQGIASYPQDAGSAYELVYAADMALYRAKNRGRDQIIVSGS
jgi:diguanylate cyclase (GGDEF)-like protein